MAGAMNDEKKEDTKENPTTPQGQAEVKAEVPKPEAPKAEAPKAEAAAPQSAPAKEEKKATPEAKKEKPSNCAGCNKSIRKKRWYYRNGKFYCSQRCWKATAKKKEASEPLAESPQNPKK